MLCTNRPEGFVCTGRTIQPGFLANLCQGPLSHLYSHSVTSCFLDTILVPLCTWLYLTALIFLTIAGSKLSSPRPSDAVRDKEYQTSKNTGQAETIEAAAGEQTDRCAKLSKALSVLYYLFLLANLLMCILELVRLSLAHLGVGFLPFTSVVLITAGAVRCTKGLGGRTIAWKYLNLGLWVALAVTNGVKIAEETKEGTGARKGSKYAVSDQITDVSVMIGVYAILGALELSLRT
ncbi:MAG: hypothetical protein Q9222_001182 [Ikaeria aurantiellina]